MWSKLLNTKKHITTATSSHQPSTKLNTKSTSFSQQISTSGTSHTSDVAPSSTEYEKMGGSGSTVLRTNSPASSSKLATSTNSPQTSSRKPGDTTIADTETFTKGDKASNKTQSSKQLMAFCMHLHIVVFQCFITPRFHFFFLISDAVTSLSFFTTIPSVSSTIPVYPRSTTITNTVSPASNITINVTTTGTKLNYER